MCHNCFLLGMFFGQVYFPDVSTGFSLLSWKIFPTFPQWTKTHCAKSSQCSHLETPLLNKLRNELQGVDKSVWTPHKIWSGSIHLPHQFTNSVGNSPDQFVICLWNGYPINQHVHSLRHGLPRCPQNCSVMDNLTSVGLGGSVQGSSGWTANAPNQQKLFHQSKARRIWQALWPLFLCIAAYFEKLWTQYKS